MAELEKVGAKALYEKLKSDREPYLKRARRAAELTVPYLMPAEGTSGSTDFTEPAQGLGARGLRHVASKLSNSLFPVNQPFFKHTVDDLTLSEITEGSEMNRGVIEEALSARERAVMTEFNSSLFRPIAFEACRQLTLAGNYLVYIPKEGKPRGFRLNSFVVDRDGSGNLLDLVIHEEIAKTALPPEIAQKINQVGEVAESTRDTTVGIYTHVSLMEDGNTYSVSQEINGVTIEGEYAGEYPKDALPFVPLRFSYVEGEDYGRGFVDEYIGDLNSLETMTVALRDGTIQGAKVVWMVAPNSTVSAKRLADAPNGGFVTGEHNSVVPLRLEKQADFAVAERYIAQVSERLAFAFLLNSAVQRQGERVTAEEIRYMAGELDQALGGVYSLMSEEFQMPVVKLFQLRMEHSRKVSPLPKEITETSIVTGLEALGRGNDLQNLDALLGGGQQLFGPEVHAKYINPGEYYKRRGASLGIDMAGLVRSQEEIAESDRLNQLRQLAQHLGPQAISQMGGIAKEGMKGEGAQQLPPEETGEEVNVEEQEPPAEG